MDIYIIKMNASTPVQWILKWSMEVDLYQTNIV